MFCLIVLLMSIFPIVLTFVCNLIQFILNIPSRINLLFLTECFLRWYTCISIVKLHLLHPLSLQPLLPTLRSFSAGSPDGLTNSKARGIQHPSKAEQTFALSAILTTIIVHALKTLVTLLIFIPLHEHT